MIGNDDALPSDGTLPNLYGKVKLAEFLTCQKALAGRICLWNEDVMRSETKDHVVAAFACGASMPLKPSICMPAFGIPVWSAQWRIWGAK